MGSWGSSWGQGIGTRWLLSDIAATAHCSAETHQPIFHIAGSTLDSVMTSILVASSHCAAAQITLRPNWDPNYTPTCNYITIASMLHLCLISTCRSRWCRRQNRAQLSVTASSRRALAESSCPRPTVQIIAGIKKLYH